MLNQRLSKFVAQANKRKLILLAPCVFLLLSCSQSQTEPQDHIEPEQAQTKLEQNSSPSAGIVDAKTNVVFVLVDDLGYADIGVYNPKSFYKTPNIDKLAKEGIMFTDGYAANPVCSPTRAAIMTGKHPTRMKATEWFHINDWPHRVERFRAGHSKEYMGSEELTIAEIFKGQGYHTSFIGKWHLGNDESRWPTAQGFDVNLGGAGFGYPRGGYFSPYNNPNLSDGPEGEYLTDRLTSEATQIIQDHQGSDTPFFLFLSYYTVHVPLEAPQTLIEDYEAKKAGSDPQADFADEDQYFISEPAPRSVRVKQNHPTYAAMIEKLDDNVGRIIDALKASGQYDNTIVVFTSDNGGLSTSEGHPTSNLPLRGGKGWLYEGGIRVPLIMHVPQRSNQAGAKIAGTTIATQAVSMDFLPTLAKLAGVTLPSIDGMDGADLSAQLLDPNTSSKSDRPLFWHYPHYSNQGGFPGAAVRKGSYKLLQNFEDGSLQLYDLSNDLAEKNDIKAKFPQKVQELQALLNEWYVETDAEFLRPREDAPDQLPWVPAQ